MGPLRGGDTLLAAPQSSSALVSASARSVGLELSSIDKSGVLSSGVTREEWSKTQLAAPAQPAEGAEGEQAAAPQKVVNELQAIQTPREIQDSLWDTLPPVQHKRGRPIDNIRRKALLHDTGSDVVARLLDMFGANKKGGRLGLDEDGNIRLDVVFNGWRSRARLNKPVRDELRLRKQVLDCLTKPFAERTASDVGAFMTFLSRATALSDLKMELLAELCRQAFVPIIGDDHDVIFRAGDNDIDPSLYVILYGRVSQWNGTAEGDSLRPVNVISQLYAGDAFGMEWTREDQPRPYSIVTEEATVLISVKRTHFYAVEQSVFRDILNERIDLLCRIPQFRETRLRKVRDAAAAMTVLEYRAGQVLMVQGAGATYTGIVLSGTVDLIFTCDDERGVSRRSRLASVGPGSVIGAHAMIGKGTGTQPVSVVANTNVLCMAFSSADHTYRIGPEAQKAFADTAGGYPTADDMKDKLNQAGNWAAYKSKVLEKTLFNLSLRAIKQDVFGRLKDIAASGAHLTDVQEMSREKVEDLPWTGLNDEVGAFTEFLPSCPMLLARVAQMDAAGRPLPTEFFELLFDIWDTAALELGIRITRRRRGELMAMPFPEDPLDAACARLAEMAIRMRRGLQAVVEKVQALRHDAQEAQSRQQMMQAADLWKKKIKNPGEGAAGARAKNVAGNLASVVKAARSKGPITAEGLLTPEAMQQLAAAQQAATKVGLLNATLDDFRRAADALHTEIATIKEPPLSNPENEPPLETCDVHTASQVGFFCGLAVGDVYGTMAVRGRFCMNAYGKGKMAVMAVYEAACAAERAAEGEDVCAGEIRMSKRFSQLLSPADFVCEPAQPLPPLKEAYSTRKALFQIYDEGLGNLPADPLFVKALNSDAFNLVGRAGVNPENPRGISELKGPLASSTKGKKITAGGLGMDGQSRGSVLGGKGGARSSMTGLPPVTSSAGDASQQLGLDGAHFSRGGRYGAQWSAQADGHPTVAGTRGGPGGAASRDIFTPQGEGDGWYAGTAVLESPGSAMGGRRGGGGKGSRRGAGGGAQRQRGRSATLPGITGRAGGVLPIATVPNMRVVPGGAMSNGLMRKHGPPLRSVTGPPRMSSGPVLDNSAAGMIGVDSSSAMLLAAAGAGNNSSGRWQSSGGDVDGGGVLRPSNGSRGRVTGDVSLTGSSKWF